MSYPGANGGPIPNYDNYGNPVSPAIGGEGSAPITRYPALGANGIPLDATITPGAGQTLLGGQYPVPAGSQSVPPPPGGSDALVAQGIYPDGALPADPNAPVPPGPSALPPLPGATPTTAAAQATGFPQSAWSLALHQRMANGGVGPAMDFYNFVKSRGVMPPVDPNAPLAPPPIQQPRPLVISPTNTSPGQIIPGSPQGPAPQGPGGPPMPQQPPMPNVAQPNVPPPGQIPGGVPQNPQMPGFYGMGRGPAQR